MLAGAPALLIEAKGLAAAAAAKKDEIMKALAAQWTELSGLRASDWLLRLRRAWMRYRRPVGYRRVDVAAAKSGLRMLRRYGSKAQAAFQSNHVADAVKRRQRCEGQGRGGGSGAENDLSPRRQGSPQCATADPRPTDLQAGLWLS